jgi:peptide/nickel transport system permease protein
MRDADTGLSGRQMTVEAPHQVQLAEDAQKRFSWPVYATTLRARFRCHAAVLVVTIDPKLARWAAQPIDLKKLGLAAVAQDEMSSLWRIVFIVALLGWTRVARIVRGTTLAARQEPYVRAARALGAGHARIMAVHILPNIASPIIVAITLTIGEVILIESVLSFLGLGIQPPLASWGNMLTNAQEMLWRAPMLAVWPGLCIFVTVICFNFLGDGLQDALDPRSRPDAR